MQDAGCRNKVMSFRIILQTVLYLIIKGKAPRELHSLAILVSRPTPASEALIQKQRTGQS